MTPTTDCAVLFDLDGTLLDTAPDLAGAVNDLRIAAGQDALPLHALAPMCSYGGRGMLQAGFGLYPDDADYRATYDRFIAQYHARMTRDTHPYDGMRAVIRQIVARGWQWGVVTNKAEYLAQPIIEAMAFDPAPACVVGGDSVPNLKPDPASLLRACELTGLTPTRCIYVGDSARDMQAGANAGMLRIGVGYGYIPSGDDIELWDCTRAAASVAELGDTIHALQAVIQDQDSA